MISIVLFNDLSLCLSIFRSSVIVNQRVAAAGKKHDLSKWKYAELRDAINTSCGKAKFASLCINYLRSLHT